MQSETDADLARILSYAEENNVPVLLPESAAFLKQIFMLSRPKKVFEIGTAIGYSGMLALKYSAAHLFTVESNEAEAAKAKEFFAAAGLMSRVTLFVGDACEIVPLAEGRYDLIFMDGPKTRYLEYLPYLKRMLGPGGILLCDNVLFNGWVAGETPMKESKRSIVTRLDEFLHALSADPDFCTSVLPVGDGLSLSIRTE